MSDVRCCLARLTTSYDGLRVDKAEGIDDDLAFNGLDGVNDNSDRPQVQRLERLDAIVRSGIRR